ncbi:uncharacterized protein LOC115313153 [Ixodes scapularis]|uniref:uncharacterized protein LOC115313153 n=1 Tax=Ixodes scapularis TaxID=6945 RepID=UPI001A9D788C|nr:uncharacterized protein LOC115313153 [Ixodes scapularis]
MAKLVKVAVRCTRAALNVRLEFDHPFRGLVYSKGHFGDPECRHVHGDSTPGAAESRRTFEFAVRADRCGSTKVERKPREGDSYLENTIVVQSELGIQDWSDSARRLRCSWDSNTERTVSSSISVDQLDVIAARYAGSSAADSYMDVQHGRGPFSAPVTGLVKIGETLTLVVYALGSDVHVKDCLAHDGDLGHTVQLTDAHGCVAKPKLLGPWQKTTKTGATGASTIAFAYLKAFKFPDKVEVYLECNIEMCKRQCSELCSGARRSKRQGLNESSGLAEPARVTRGIRVVAPDDAPEHDDWRSGRLATGDVCMSLPGFVTSLSAILALLLGSCLASVSLLVRVRQLAALPTSPAATKSLMDSDTGRKCRHL